MILAGAPTPRTILFVFADPGRMRYFESVLELLVERGHRVHAAIEQMRERIPGQLGFVEELSVRHPGLTFGAAPRAATGGWGRLARQLRQGLDYLHYLQPRFDDAPDFRERAERDAPKLVRRLARVPGLGRRPLERALELLERSLPVRGEVERFLVERRADIVLLTPFVWFGAPQTDWLRAARTLGARVGACLFSWDNLTSKGSIRELPDFLSVWNEAQVEEAVTLHGVPRERLVVTGAQNWDHWFSWGPSRSRADFLREVGLPAERPLVLYLGSSGYVGDERAFALEWLRAVRGSSHERLREAGVLVRPHPQAASAWAEAGLAELGPVAVWPPAGEVPLDAGSRRNFFDSLFHADAVVGVNTSAFIESAILGRPSLTLLLPQFRKGQLGTVHFHHLLPENGGPLVVGRSLAEHAEQLAAALSGDGPGEAVARGFVERFVRPLGLESPAAARLVEAIEAACARPAAAPRPAAAWQRLVRRAMARLVREDGARDALRGGAA